MKKTILSLAIAATALVALPATAGVTFYEGENFSGRPFTADGTVPNFVERGFNDRAKSAVVTGAPVEVCLDINFNGGCTVLQTGRYSSLGDMGNKISSVRPVAVTGRRDEGRGRGNASAILFSGPNLAGRSVTLDRAGAPELANFNERASSLVVERGYWIFCTEPQYQGECRTFGPGEYKQLPPGFDNKISSGRQISNNYPYSNRPNWDGGNRGQNR